MKSVILILLLGAAMVSAHEQALKEFDAWEFITINIIDPFVEAVIDNTVNLIVNGIVSLFGKRSLKDFDAWEFITINIIDPFVDAVIENTVNLIVGGIVSLFGKRSLKDFDAWEFITINIIDPFVDAVIENTVNLIVGGIVSLFGKRSLKEFDAWEFITINIIDPFVDAVIENTVNLIVGGIVSLFGKRAIEFDIVSVIKPLIVNLANQVVSIFGSLFGSLLLLAHQEIVTGHSVAIAIQYALEKFDNDLQVAIHRFLSNIVQITQHILDNAEVSQLYDVLSVLLWHFHTQISQLVPHLTQLIFALINHPFVLNILTQLMG